MNKKPHPSPKRHAPQRATDKFSDVDVLRGMLGASNDACWCMEFGTPVDLTLSDDDVARQIFGNDPYWRLCNAAMERLYQVPAGQKLSERPVREVFPENSSNLEFVRNLIANGFEVDAAPALDRGYDGVEIYVENDVRAHIAEGKLYRMFGVVRNVGKHRRRERELESRLDALQSMIWAIPAPFLAVDAAGMIEVVNAAGALCLGALPEALLGQSLDSVLPTDAPQANVLHAMSKVRTLAIPIAERFSGAVAGGTWHFTPYEAPGGTGCLVMILPEMVTEVCS
ncbi:PAS domain-containing protein [Thioclava sp.]|uniref:PAS domain-containing protein n=1 Tax=Thioclava sp. TaxID=1933450 RepID=UPI003AA84E7A